ncbi:MAG: phage major capsid protein [Clostridiales bacterium]|nr:phage major capsid protein [Clostridiales bacterium]
MNKFQYMTKKEINDYVSTLESELRTCGAERMREIEVEIRAAYDSVTKGQYRDLDDEGEEFRSERLNGPLNGAQGLQNRNKGIGFDPFSIYGNMRTIASFPMGNQNGKEGLEDKYASMEYRKAFMDYVLTGKKGENLEFRSDVTTATTDIGAVIPSTIMNRIVEKMQDYGEIWARVTKTSFPGGLKIPVSNLKPVATWVTEGNVASKQKKDVSTYISFLYYKLQCRVAVSLIAGTVSLNIFENTIVDNINEAMITALEAAVISGAGEESGQPLGITKDTGIPVGQIIEVDDHDFCDYSKWAEIIGKMPRKHRNKCVIIMNNADWNKYIVGMLDANGQPIARVNFGLNGIQQEIFLGKPVIPVEDYLPSYNDAEVGDIVAVICNLEDYIINSNMQLSFKRYFDEDTDEWINKSTMICDGKLADKNGVLLLKKM